MELGSSEGILRTRTLLPFYFPLRSATEVVEVVGQLRLDGIGGAKARLGIPASRFGAQHPLKACETCAREDLSNYGTGYWHLHHQFPGAIICLRHGSLLVRFEHTRFMYWRLPPRASDFPAPIGPTDPSPLFRHITEAAIFLASLPAGFHFDRESLASTYLAALGDRDLAEVGRNARLSRIADAYCHHVAPIRDLPGWAGLPVTRSAAQSQLRSLLAAEASHPLRHLLFITWLFGTWQSFWRYYSSARRFQPVLKFDVIVPHANGASRADRKRAKCELTAMVRSGMSVRKSAAAIGIDTSTAMAWLAQEGIATNRRPKSINPELRKRLVQDLRRGREKRWIASKYRLSIQSVTNVLRTEPGLHLAWIRIRALLECRRRRRKWISAIATESDPTLNSVQKAAPSTYAWLRRHDKDWLLNQATRLRKAMLSNNSTGKWQVLDDELGAQLSLWLADREVARPTLGEVCNGLPTIAHWIKRLDRLPKTAAVLARATRSPAPDGDDLNPS
jgi:hypothetical protein